MPTVRFAMERSGPKRLEVSWKFGWKEFQVRLDGAPMGSAEGKSELQAGREFELPDGSRLHVQLTKQLQLTRNGKPVPGSAGDPMAILKMSYGLIFFIGGANLVVGVLAEAMGDSTFSAVFGWPDAVVGALFVGLGLFVRRRSTIALGVAVALLGGILLLRVVGGLAAISQGGVPMGIGGIALGIVFLISICKGFGAISQLEAEAPDDTRPASAAE